MAYAVEGLALQQFAPSRPVPVNECIYIKARGFWTCFAEWLDSHRSAGCVWNGFEHGKSCIVSLETFTHIFVCFVLVPCVGLRVVVGGENGGVFLSLVFKNGTARNMLCVASVSEALSLYFRASNRFMSDVVIFIIVLLSYFCVSQAPFANTRKDFPELWRVAYRFAFSEG